MNQDKIKFYMDLKERVKHDYEYIKIAQDAIMDGLREENETLRNQKSKVEVGFSVYHSMNKKKIKKQYIPVINWAIDSCTFVPNNRIEEDTREG